MKLLFLVILGLTFNEFLSENVLEKNNEVLSRQKRLDMDTGTGSVGDFTGDPYTFPILIPRYANSGDVKNSKRTPKWGTCLLYMEGITIVGINHARPATNGQKAVYAIINGTSDGGKSPNNTMWEFNSDDSMDCTIRNVTGNDTNVLFFHIKLDTKGVDAREGNDVAFTVASLEFRLNFVLKSVDVWYLDNIQLYDITLNPGKSGFLDNKITISDFGTGNITSSPLVKDIRGMYGYSYGCSATPGIFFETNSTTNKGYAIGLQFTNFQVELYNIYYNANDTRTPIGVQFKATVNDCVPTFSVGSWMSIIASLVLAAVFFFGFLMLNAIQTMDRFDDPKAKQIIINTKE